MFVYFAYLSLFEKSEGYNVRGSLSLEGSRIINCIIIREMSRRRAG